MHIFGQVDVDALIRLPIVVCSSLQHVQDIRTCPRLQVRAAHRKLAQNPIRGFGKLFEAVESFLSAGEGYWPESVTSMKSVKPIFEMVANVTPWRIPSR